MRFVIPFLVTPIFLFAINFKVASYNVENLFDLKYDGSEYKEYIPNGKFGWNKKIYLKKLNNTAKVLKDLNADIVALEEIESKTALKSLQKILKLKGLNYPYIAMADSKKSSVKVSLLSRFKITKKAELKVAYGVGYRNILEAHIDIKGNELIIFVNHWRSKRAKESERIKYAKALKRRLDELKPDTDFIVLGDFNSNYNEFETFKNEKRLNNTKGKTGINHILKTITRGEFVTKQMLLNNQNCKCLYNLWLEVEPRYRWSHNFKGDKGTLDNILLPPSLFDNSGISYIDNSFGRLEKKYLFKGGNQLFRWQRKNGWGKHIGIGYSDHLPIFAYFSTEPFKKKEKTVFKKEDQKDFYKVVTIKDIYDMPIGEKKIEIKNAAVIYKDRYGCIIKQKNGRAIYLFKHNKLFAKGYIYNLIANKIYDYYGLREITGIEDASRIKKVTDLNDYYLKIKADLDLTLGIYQNEVIDKISGIYKNGFLHYGKGKKIKLYFAKKTLKPKNGSKIILKRVRVSTYKGRAQIVVNYKPELCNRIHHISTYH